MNKNSKFVILIISISIILIGCNQTNKVKNPLDNGIDNGIDNQILNIIGKMDEYNNKKLYFTIWFYSENDSNYVRFINSVPILLDGSLVSEQPYFSGYKNLDSSFLVFMHDNLSCDFFNRFVIKDSLNFDNKPFEVLDSIMSPGIFEPTQLIYYINENDSLIYLKEEHI